MTGWKQQTLRIDMTDWDGDTSYVEYDDFEIANEKENFYLKRLGSHIGIAG